MSDDLYLLGRRLGTYSGWDCVGDPGDLVFYEFEPAEGVDLPPGDLAFLTDRGVFVTYEDDGSERLQLDAVEVTRRLPRAFDLTGDVPE